MRIVKFAIAVLFIFLISGTSSATVPEYAKPIRAYQEKYDMSFFVWEPAGLHNKWYATYDGYPVAEIERNLWVYGVIGNAGQLIESTIAVGSVDPKTVYILSTLPSFINVNVDEENGATGPLDSLKGIFKTKCNSFGIAYTNASHTPIAWKSDTFEVYMWGGKKWVRIYGNNGEWMRDTIRRDSNIIADMLRDNGIIWTQLDTYEFANYVRIAGYTWIGNFETNMPVAFCEPNNNAGNVNDSNESGGGTGNPGGGGWDTGR